MRTPTGAALIITDEMASSPRIKVKYILTHPIQYFSPLFRRLAGYDHLDFEVIYASDAGAREYFDPGFSRSLTWDSNPLEGYRNKILCPGMEIKGGFRNVKTGGVGSLIEKKGTDVAIIHGWGNLFYAAATYQAIKKKIPVLYRTEINKFYDPAAFRPITRIHKTARKLKPVMASILFKKIDGFLAIGSLNREYYLSVGVNPEKIFWTPYSIDDAKFRQARVGAEERAREEQKLGLGASSFRVLFCGKLIERKRPQDIIEAVAKMPSRDKVQVIFIGEGELRPGLASLAREKHVQALFPGFINQQSLPVYYSLGDVLVLPSGNEPWGLVVNEAMAMGLPAIVSSMVGCGPDLVCNDESGYICPVGDSSAMATTLEKMISSPALLDRLKQGARSKISGFSLDHTLQGYIQAITAVTGRFS